MWGIIATWSMALDGVKKASQLLNKNIKAGDAIEIAIRDVEDNPFFKSVGYGGLPNMDMEVELDSGYMDGTSLDIGAVCGIRDFANPISIAKALSKEHLNNILNGVGAEKYAAQHGFERKNMLTDRAITFYKNQIKKEALKPSVYKGHDTVSMVCLDTSNNIVAATSTSGLFMKKKGRIGDSPVVGSGFYANSLYGGVGSTGVGEDVMRGCLSYEIVRLMKDGYTPQIACEIVVNSFSEELKKRRKDVGDISMVAMNNKGEWGVATNIDTFSFVVATSNLEPTVFLTKRVNNKCIHEKASEEWIKEYIAQRMLPVKEN